VLSKRSDQRWRSLLRVRLAADARSANAAMYRPERREVHGCRIPPCVYSLPDESRAKAIAGCAAIQQLRDQQCT
jgi:hypothetical protein